MEDLPNSFFQIISAGRNTNSYKFALARALVRLAPDTDPKRPVIAKGDLAPLFVEYYWPLEVTYHIRQGIDPDKDPVVMKYVRNLVSNGRVASRQDLADFRKGSLGEYQALLAAVERDAFDDVIPRFHNVRGTSINPRLFTFTGKEGKAGNTVTLTDVGRAMLVEYGKLLDYIAVSGWVRFTEAFSSAPKLHDKIAGLEIKRGSLTQWRTALADLQQGKCFYCASDELLASDVDHFLPWSFVLEDKSWNLVLSCRPCNNAKRDKLPGVAALERLIQRNRDLVSGRSKVDSKFVRHFAEWRSRDLSGHVKILYDHAAEDGFPDWAH